MIDDPAKDWGAPEMSAPWLPTAVVLSSGLWGMIVGVFRYAIP